MVSEKLKERINEALQEYNKKGSELGLTIEEFTKRYYPDINEAYRDIAGKHKEHDFIVDQLSVFFFTFLKGHDVLPYEGTFILEDIFRRWTAYIEDNFGEDKKDGKRITIQMDMDPEIFLDIRKKLSVELHKNHNSFVNQFTNLFFTFLKGHEIMPHEGTFVLEDVLKRWEVFVEENSEEEEDEDSE